jgi:hypothetical protein
VFGIVCFHDYAPAQFSKFIDVDNDLFKISFDKGTATWSVYEKVDNDWRTVLHNVSTRFITHTPDSLWFLPAENDATGKVEKFSDAIGTGTVLSIRTGDRDAQWVFSFVLYDGKKAGTVTASVKNTSEKTWKKNELHLLDLHDAAYMQFATNNVVMHVNGFQSWSSSDVVQLDSVNSHKSYWSTIFYEPEAYRSVLLGFITNTVAVNSITTEPFNVQEGVLRLQTDSDVKTLEVPPGGEVTSDRFIISFDASPAENLRQYAQNLQVMAPQINKPFTPITRQTTVSQNDVPTGWCSWYYYYQHISEDSILQNLNFAARQLKRAGMKYIQIDDGYQQFAGDWEMNKKFPHGHKWFVEQIHAKGFLAGLWIAPFAVAEHSSIYREHPDWLLRDEHDSLKMFSANDWWGGRIYSLDPSIPEVQSWLENLFYTATHWWGYDYVKIDFLYFAGEGEAYHVPMSSTQAYQKGLQAIRRGVGSDKFILGCGAPLGSSVGYVDGMRIGTDVYAGWGGITPGVQAAAQRTLYHNNVWYNDPDCLLVRDPLSLDQARAWASVVALSGQMNMMSDKLAALPKERLDVLKMTLPSYGTAATPVDLFTLPQAQGLTIHSHDNTSRFTLPSSWKFMVGDSMKWKESSYNDEHWKEISVPAHWEETGYPGLDGFAWYRVAFTLPADWKQDSLVFDFGKIDDCDETYLNGTLIGRTGTMPPNYNSEWTTFRRYTIPAKNIRWGEENVLTVRVYDGGGPGGVYSTSESNLPALWNLTVDKAFETWNILGVFNWSEQPVTKTISFSQLGFSPKKTYLAYELWSDEFIGELSKEFTSTLSPTSSKIFSIHEKSNHPVILSTNRHITQGGVDIVREEWDENKKTLSVISENLINDDVSIILYVPSGYSLKNIVAPCSHETTTGTGKTVKITLHPGGISKVAWKAVF